jgi:hypothetical protein
MRRRYMKRTFIQTKEFSKRWDELGFTDQDLRRLEMELLDDPEIGKVIQGTGKLRKMRFAFENRGKSGSTRVCYVDFEVYETIYLITVFAKNQQENLSRSEKNDIKKAIINLEHGISKKE